MSQIRIEKDLKDIGRDYIETDYNLLTIKSSYVESKILTMRIEVFCKNGLYSHAKYNFLIFIPEKYPHFPPRLFCTSTIYHPNVNIDTGEVSLSILDKSNWKPVLTLRSILTSLDMIIIEPNLDYIANHPISVECAHLFSENNENFKERVRFTLLGGYFFGNYRFPPNQYSIPDSNQSNTKKRQRNVVESTIDFYENGSGDSYNQKRFFPGCSINAVEERLNLETELEDLATRFNQLNQRDLLQLASKPSSYEVNLKDFEMQNSGPDGLTPDKMKKDGKVAVASDEVFHELFAVKCAFETGFGKTTQHFKALNSSTSNLSTGIGSATEENLGMALD